MAVALKKPSTWAQYKTLLRKDLEQEFRTKEMLTSMGIYALLVLVVYGAALAQTTSTLDVLQMSGGLLWALIVFTSLLGLNRSFAHEKEQGCLEGILLVPLDRSVIFLAKATSNLLFLLAVEVVAVPLFYFFFLTTVTPGESFWLLAVPLFVGTVGVAGIGTLLSTITVNTRGKDVMLAVLFIPLDLPASVGVRVGDDRGRRGCGRVHGRDADVVGARRRLRRRHAAGQLGAVRFRYFGMTVRRHEGQKRRRGFARLEANAKAQEKRACAGRRRGAKRKAWGRQDRRMRGCGVERFRRQ